MNTENMYMYVLPGCPFCAKVDTFLQNAGIELEHRSITEGINREDLQRIGGKVQCPCLVVDGVPMYESDDIIAYFQGQLL